MLLRYPGTKSALAKRFADVESSVWCEPFVGAGGMALNLAKLNSKVEWFELADADEALVCLWNAVLSDSARLRQLVQDFTPSLAEWDRLTDVLKSGSGGAVQRGFAKLAVHQMSYSGLGERAGGPIGGRAQAGRWTIECRWRPKNFLKKAEKIRTLLAGRINAVHCRDWKVHLDAMPDNADLYLDPPYYDVGGTLYKEGLDHTQLAGYLEGAKQRWWLSYDKDPWVLDRYSFATVEDVDFQYTLGSKRTATEVLISHA